MGLLFLSSVTCDDGSGVCCLTGFLVGISVAVFLVGPAVGSSDGTFVGPLVGEFTGASVGISDGSFVGRAVRIGASVTGATVGSIVIGASVGVVVSAAIGFGVGKKVVVVNVEGTVGKKKRFFLV